MPGATFVVALMTDVDLLPGGKDLTRYCYDQLKKTFLTGSRVASYKPLQRARIVSASSQTLARVTGAGWVAVGDAAAAFDPLSSSGVINALESGIRAAKLITNTDGSSGNSYDNWVARSVENFLRNRASYYELEGRWPNSPFWSRRHAERSQPPRPEHRLTTETQAQLSRAPASSLTPAR